MTQTIAPIAVVGSLNMDIVLEVTRAPESGETVLGRTLKYVPGGKGANQAVACARLGGCVALIGCIGADRFGEELRQSLARDNVLTDHVDTIESAHTGVALITVEESGQNRIVVIPGANGLFSAAHVDAAGEIIDRAELVLLQLEISMSAVEHVIQRAARTGRRTLLNPAPAQALSPSLLNRVDFLVPNEKEASQLTGIDVVDVTTGSRAAQELLRRGARCVLLTLGAQGVLIADKSGVRQIAAPQVTALDTTAAGDTFIGAFAVGIIEGMGLDSAAKLACHAAALSVTRIGAQTSIPYRRELVT